MPASDPQPEDVLDALRDALRRLPGVQITGNGGTMDDDGWWHISLTIDRANSAAWHSVAVLAKLFNTDRHQDGSALFKPSARLAEAEGEEDLILWSLSHQYGDFTPAFAAAAIERHLAGHKGNGKVEE